MNLAPTASWTAVDQLRARLVAGAPAGDVRAAPPRVRRAVELAQELGAPTLAALDAAAEAAADDRAAHDARTVATAQASAVARVLAAFPLAAVPGLGRLLDLPLVGFYLTPTGRMVALVALLLAAAGAATSRLLTSRVLRPGRSADVDEVYELVAVALTSGLAPGEALRAAARHTTTYAAPLRRLAFRLDHGLEAADPHGPAELAALEGVLRATGAFGAPVAPALRRLARELRADERSRVEAAAQRLPAHLTFPTVLLLLPASLLLVGAPILATGIASVAAT